VKPAASGFGGFGGFGSSGGVKVNSFGAVSASATGASPFLLVKPAAAGGAPFTLGKPASGAPSTTFQFKGFGSASTSAAAFGKGKPAPFALASPAVPSDGASVDGKEEKASPRGEDKPAASEEGESGDEGDEGSGDEAVLAAPPEYKVEAVVLKEDTGTHVTGEEAEVVRFSLARAKLYKLMKKAPKKTDYHAEAGAEEGAEAALAIAGNKGAAEDATEAAAADTPAEKKEVALPHGAVLTEWRESGLGTVKLLVPKDGGKGRVVMRREKTESLILNVSLTGMATKGGVKLSGDKAVKFTVLTEEEAKLVPVTFLLKTKTKQEAELFLAAVDAALTAGQ